MIIPAGLSSEANFGAEKFFVQTEFAQRPQPRVTTTISINGAVVEKVENIWERLPQTEEEREEIERYLKKQHQQVLQKIKDKKEKLVSFDPEKGETIFSEDEMILKVREVLSKTEGVSGWVFIPDYEQMISFQISEPEDREAEDLVRRIRDITSFLPLVDTLGKLVGGILNLPERSMIFLPLMKHILAVQLDPRVDSKDLVKRIKSIS